MDIPIKSTGYITAFKLITGKKSSEVRRISADPTANNQLIGLVKKRKNSLREEKIKPQNSATNTKNSTFGKKLTDFYEKDSVDSHSK